MKMQKKLKKRGEKKMKLAVIFDMDGVIADSETFDSEAGRD